MMEEPVGLMFCLECMTKHGRDLEHHLEDAVRVTQGKEREQYENLIDRVRNIRKELFGKLVANQTAKTMAATTPSGFCETCGNGGAPVCENCEE